MLNMDEKKLKHWLMAGAAATILGAAGVRWAGRTIANKMFDRFYRILSNDMYDENLWELISSTIRLNPEIAIETHLRASNNGKMIERPMGNPFKFPSLDSIKFNIAQFEPMPVDVTTEIDTSVTIGKMAAKPFTIKAPVMIAPMAYGIAISKPVAIALAKSATMADIAINSGAGPLLQEIRDEAKILIYQYNRGDWGKTPEILQNCEAIEIQFGQGAYAGAGHIIKSQLVDKRLRKDFKVPPGKDLITHSRQPEVQRPEDLPKLIEKLRSISGGVPIGAKIGAGKYLERDLYWLCSSGIDFISLDGAEAGTKGSPPILQDDFGVPTVFATYRAAKWLEENGYKDRVSLIVSGKIRTPGDVLKVCALGADACYIGTVALFAVSHGQIEKALPFEPPTALTWYEGRHSKRFNINLGAESLNNFLEACRLELMEGIRALGKTSISQVSRDDLICIDEVIAKGCNIPMAYQPLH